MVDRQLLTGTAAVLTTVIIPIKHIATSQRHLSKRNTHVLTQANHRGEMRTPSDFPAHILFETLGFPFQHHHHGSSPGGDI
jgi:uncharacterized protein YceK